MKALVCGLGPSLALLRESRYRGLVVGVNDIEAHGVVPHHLVVCDQPGDFADHRRDAITKSTSPVVWTTQAYTWGVGRHKRFIGHAFKYAHLEERSPMGCEFEWREDDESTGPRLRTAYTTAFSAADAAFRIGATSIALLGIDITEDHSTYGHLAEIDAAFARMHAALRERGVELLNLSEQSNLRSVPKWHAMAWLNS